MGADIYRVERDSDSGSTPEAIGSAPGSLSLPWALCGRRDGFLNTAAYQGTLAGDAREPSFVAKELNAEHRLSGTNSAPMLAIEIDWDGISYPQAASGGVNIYVVLPEGVNEDAVRVGGHNFTPYTLMQLPFISVVGSDSFPPVVQIVATSLLRSFSIVRFEGMATPRSPRSLLGCNLCSLRVLGLLGLLGLDK